MHLVLLELTQQVVNLLGFWYEVRRTYQRLPTEVVSLRQMGQQVLDIQDATHVVAIVLIYGNARVVVFYHTLHHLLERSLEVKIHHVLTRSHNLLGGLVTKAHNTFQHALLFLNIFLIGQFQRLLQVVYTQRMTLLGHHFVCQSSGTHHNSGNGIEDLPAEQDTSHCSATETQRMLSTIHLRHDFTKKQQQEGQQHCHTCKLQPPRRTEVHRVAEEISAEHDDGDVHQIVGYQYGSQRTL